MESHQNMWNYNLTATDLWNGFLLWGTVILVSSVLSFGALWLAVCIAPPDLFFRTGERPHNRHPLLHLIWVITRNVLGYVMIVIGAIYLIFPGPGMPWLLLGAALVDLPGKRNIVRKMILMRSVQICLDWLRRRGGQVPFLYPHDMKDESGSRHPEGH